MPLRRRRCLPRDQVEAVLVGLCTVLEDEESPFYDAANAASAKIAALLPGPETDSEDWTDADFADPRELVRAIHSAVRTERTLLIALSRRKGEGLLAPNLAYSRTWIDG